MTGADGGSAQQTFTLTVNTPTVSLAVSPTTISPGRTLTVAWAGIGAPTVTDWVALAPVGAVDTTYVAWRYTTGASDGSTGLTIPASVTPGTYELRLFARNGWQRLAVSELVTVAATITLTASPATIARGGTLTVVWEGIGVPSATDWVALAPVGAADTTYVAWQYTTGTGDGSMSLTIPASVIRGTYELRLFARNGLQRLAVSEPVRVSEATPLTASPAEVAPGGSLMVTWHDQLTSSATDWLALTLVNGPDASYVAWAYATGRPSDSAFLLLPDAMTAGSYEVRLYANNTYTRLAVSNSVTVSAPGPSLTASPAATAPGGTLTMRWQNIAAPTALDWVGLYAVGAEDEGYLTRWYTTGRASDRLLAVLPGSLADGSYELRLFADDTWTRLATSNAFQRRRRSEPRGQSGDVGSGRDSHRHVDGDRIAHFHGLGRSHPAECARQQPRGVDAIRRALPVEASVSPSLDPPRRAPISFTSLRGQRAASGGQQHDTGGTDADPEPHECGAWRTGHRDVGRHLDADLDGLAGGGSGRCLRFRLCRVGLHQRHGW